jgi:hypothetical protein
LRSAITRAFVFFLPAIARSRRRPRPPAPRPFARAILQLTKFVVHVNNALRNARARAAPVEGDARPPGPPFSRFYDRSKSGIIRTKPTGLKG